MRAVNPCVVALMFVACGFAAPLRAQTGTGRPIEDAILVPASNKSAPFQPLFAPTVDFGPAVGGGLALAVHPVDDNLNRSLVGSDTADKIFKAGELLGELPTLLASASVVYAVGRIGDKPRVSHVGMDLIQSLAMSEALTQTLKYTTRRERPDLSGKNSFPSGHAADTFAFATALERHLGWRYAIPAYTFASYVAISRLPANRHWFSDAVFGAAVGIIAGRTVSSHEAHPFPVTINYIPGGGVSVMYVRRHEQSQ